MAARKKDTPAVGVEELLAMLTRLKLTAIRDQLDSLLDQASRSELNLREALGVLCAAEGARKDERRVQMGLSIAQSPSCAGWITLTTKRNPRSIQSRSGNSRLLAGSPTVTACCC